MHGVVGGLVLRLLGGGVPHLVDDLCPAGGGVLLLHRLELVHDQFFDPAGIVDDVLEVGDLRLQLLHLLKALEDVLPVESMTEPAEGVLVVRTSKLSTADMQKKIEQLNASGEVRAAMRIL